MMQPTKMTERTIAAYALLCLIQDGLFDRANLLKACKRLGIEPGDVDFARAQLSRERRGLTETRLRVVEEVDKKARQPVHSKTGLYGNGKQKWANRREGKGGTERRCARCQEWFPANAEHFPIKSKLTGELRSYCHPCWSERQADTYLSTARREALAGAGVTFTITTDHDTVGLSCAKCGKSIYVGQEVQGDTTLTHTSCGSS